MMKIPRNADATEGSASSLTMVAVQTFYLEGLISAPVRQPYIPFPGSRFIALYILESDISTCSTCCIEMTKYLRPLNIILTN